MRSSGIGAPVKEPARALRQARRRGRMNPFASRSFPPASRARPRPARPTPWHLEDKLARAYRGNSIMSSNARHFAPRLAVQRTRYAPLRSSRELQGFRCPDAHIPGVWAVGSKTPELPNLLTGYRRVNRPQRLRARA
jgi:hypothetical protein